MSRETLIDYRSGKLKASYDKVDLVGSLDTGIATIHDGRNAKREIILVSDFRKADWEKTGGALAILKTRLDNAPLKPAITLINVSGPARENVSVDSVELSATSVGVGQKVLVRAELRNHGSSSY